MLIAITLLTIATLFYPVIVAIIALFLFGLFLELIFLGDEIKKPGRVSVFFFGTGLAVIVFFPVYLAIF